MKTRLAVLVLLALARAARADEAGPPVPPHGELAVPERTYDAGKVERGVTIRHAFVVKNVGTGQLSVDAKPG
jgi:hypothetical protein